MLDWRGFFTRANNFRFRLKKLLSFPNSHLQYRLLQGSKITLSMPMQRGIDNDQLHRLTAS
jgi:hypothetical protein